MNSFSIGQLQAFRWTAEFGSVQKAANHLNVTQPSLSNRLKQLESEVEAPLFEKHGRGLKITRFGQSFLARTLVVLDAYEDLQRFSQPPELSGKIRIGVAEGYAIACMPELTSALQEAYPLLRPEWTVATSPGMEEQVVKGELDLAILVEPIGLRDARLFSLGLQENCWAVSGGAHPQVSATPADISKLKIISTPPPTAMYRATLGWLAEEKLSPAQHCVCSSLNAALQLVSAGLGAGIFPMKVVSSYPSKGTLRILEPRPSLSGSRVFVADRITADEIKTQSILRIIEKVSAEIGYFKR